MQTHTDKTSDSKTQAVTSQPLERQSGDEFSTPFIDARSGAIAQRKLQALMANNSQASSLNAFQNFANNNPQVKQTAQLQSMANNHEMQERAQPMPIPGNNSIQRVQITRTDGSNVIDSDNATAREIVQAYDNLPGPNDKALMLTQLLAGNNTDVAIARFLSIRDNLGDGMQWIGDHLMAGLAQGRDAINDTVETVSEWSSEPENQRRMLHSAEKVALRLVEAGMIILPIVSLMADVTGNGNAFITGEIFMAIALLAVATRDAFTARGSRLSWLRKIVHFVATLITFAMATIIGLAGTTLGGGHAASFNNITNVTEPATALGEMEPSTVSWVFGTIGIALILGHLLVNLMSIWSDAPNPQNDNQNGDV